LLRLQQPTLGEITANLPGVSSTYFGPNASRPVIRGLEGERVRVLQNGLGILDASGTSPDHAVALDPLTARRIEVLRGPAALLYGASAVGGVVNVIDTRIPDEARAGVGGQVDARYASPASERAIAATLDYGHESGLQLHADGFDRRTGDLAIPGFAWSPQLRALAGDGGAFGTLPNSASDAYGGAFGASWVGSRGYGGASWTAFDTTYGTVAEEAVTIQLSQRRLNLAGELLAPADRWKSLRFRYVHSDYRHTEFEDDERATVFTGGGYEARLEALHAKLGPVEGVVGLQAGQFDLSAQGEEAFLPDTSSRLVSAFLYEEASHGDWRFHFGGRYDHSSVSASASAMFGPGDKRSFDSGSGAVGATWTLGNGFALSGSAAYTQRPPNYQELYANGPHVAVGAYEIGDRNLGIETSLGVDAALSRAGRDWSARLGAFRNGFRNFIGLFPTGEVAGDLPVYVYRAVKADFYGVEFEGRVQLGRSAAGTWELEGQADWLRGTDKTGGQPLPRITPPRYGAALVYSTERYDARLAVLQVTAQDRVAPGELPTSAYTMLDLALTFRFEAAAGGLTAFIKGVNLLDEDARVHASLIKDIAPLARRGVVVGLRGHF
jgi:iron complex outermembrane receptor protein